MSDVSIQDIFEKFLPLVADKSFTDEQWSAISCIRRCRTSEMGAHVSECESCHSKFIHYNSCKNTLSDVWRKSRLEKNSFS